MIVTELYLKKIIKFAPAFSVKKVMNIQLQKILHSYEDLVTTHEQTRAGFISFALEKNRRSTPYIEEARSLKVLASGARKPEDLLNIRDIRNALITASGLSDKALNYFTEKDKVKAISEMINNFLKPAGDGFIDELVYRFLLIRGDSLGGTMRNIIGALAQQKLVRCFISTLSVMGIPFTWYDGKSWYVGNTATPNIEEAKAIFWANEKGQRVLAFNLTINTVNKNVDICLFNANESTFDNKNIAKDCNESAIMFGELKGGIDPAGADEHWKTGNSALNRIRKSFSNVGRADILTSFIAAAIEDSMGREIYSQLKNNTLSFAANLTVSEQLVSFCNWIISL